MKCYHMTTLDRLESINKIGLVPRNENNSKLINDNKVKVFFSEGFEGAIALFVDFDIVYNKIKNKEETLENQDLSEAVLASKNLQEYLKDGVYLCFDLDNTINERNFENGCTSETIKPERLKVVMLKDIKTKEVIYSKFDVIKYMMSKTKIENIKYYGVKYQGSPSFDVATAKIQNKVRKYYKEHFKDINYYNINDYEIFEKSLDEFLNDKAK